MKRLLTGLVLALAAATLMAQAKPASAAPAANQKLVLEFVNGSDLTVTSPDGSQAKLNIGIFEGDPIPPGATIATGPSTTAELKLTPNGSIIKLAKTTTFKVASLATTSTDKNAFELAAGKVRAIAAKGGNYEVKTQTAVCGVRGTDFAVVNEGGKSLLMVAKGLVAMQKVDAAGSILGELAVGAGQAADALASVFQAVAFDPAQFEEAFGDLGFEALDAAAVEQAEAAPAEQPAETAAETAAPVETTTVTEPTTAAEAASTIGEGLASMDKSEVESGLMKWLREVLGMEIGSVTIDGTTYSKAVIQPTINLGKFKLGLYLPVIYTSDLFNPEDWYKPEGNNEWSFGTQKDEAGLMLWQTAPVDAALDAAKDLALKIRFLEIGRQLEDPFFLKVGNLKTLTVGHGLIMRNYANDGDFPAVRRIGLNIGVDAKVAGFEALVDDLPIPEIYGGRIYFRPIGPVAIGLSGVVDTNPDADLSSAQSAAAGNPMFVSAGLDLDLPIITSELLALRFFADAAATIPWLQDPVGSRKAGAQIDFLYADGDVRNWGAAAGLITRIAMIDFRLEYRYFTGIFKPSFYDGTYDRKRSEYVLEYASYLDDATFPSTPTVMGVYGEGGFSFLKDKLSLDLGYFWPWSPELGADIDAQIAAADDSFVAELVVKKGLIPIIDVAGSIKYLKRGLVGDLVNKSFSFIDENTVFAGELVVPVPKTPMLDIALVVGTSAQRNDAGELVLDAAGKPTMSPTFSLETRLHF